MFLIVYIFQIIFVKYSFGITLPDKPCLDKSPYCNKNDCVTRPGYAIEFCQKTCGNCQGFCQESQHVSCNVSSKADCEFMLRDYCPIMCGLCRPIRRKRPKNENNSISGTTTLDTSTFARLSTSHGTILNNLGNNSSTNDKNINKQTGNEFNPMLDASKQDDENDQLFHVRRADQPSQNQPISPRAMSIFNQGKPPPTIVKAGSLPPLGVVKSSNQANQYQGPYGFPPQTTQSMGFPQVRQPADFIDYPEATMPRSYQVDYEDQMVGEMNYRPPVDYKIPANFAYPQAIPNPQQMNFRPPRPRKLAMKQARPFTPPMPFDYDGPEPSIDDILEQAQINEEVPPLPEPKPEEIKKPVIPTSFAIADLIALLGCRDKDPIICSQVGEESCRARPGFYLKLCPVKCKNCNGLVCMDSNKIDCQEMQKRGGCRLAVAAEYCPKTCNKCPTPSFIAEQQSPCRDELDTCEQLAESGVCEHPLSRVTLRSYCAKSCGFCKTSQYYLNEFSEYANQNRQPKSKRRPFLNKFFV